MASQRRHNRRRKTRGRFRALYKVLSILLILSAVTAGCIVFFRVNTVTVSGNLRYTAEEIEEVSGIQTGDYLAALNKNRIAKQILSGLPYVESVSIHRILPDKVDISVSECVVAAALQSGSDWWLLNSSGKLLETTSEEEARKHAVLTGVELLNPTAGSLALVTEEESNRWNYALQFLAVLDERGDLSQLSSLDCGTAGTFTAGYGQRYTLLLPTTADFKYLMSLLDQAMPELEEGQQDIVDFTLWESTGKIYARTSK